MLYRCPSQVRWHLRKMQVEIIPCMVLFRLMHQMFRCIKPLLCVINLGKSFPAFRVHLNQIADCRAVNPQRMADGNILFFYFHAITGCNPHDKTSFSSFFAFLFLSAPPCMPVPVPCSLLPAPITDCHCAIRWIPQMPAPQLLL